MMSAPCLALITAALTATLAGCDATDTTPDTADAAPVDGAPRAAAFDTAAPRAAAFDPAALSRHSLTGSSLAELGLLATPPGRALLATVVSCALPADASLTVINRDGTPYSFTGRFGLAPAWSQRPATRQEHQRVALCMRAHGLGTLRA